MSRNGWIGVVASAAVIAVVFVSGGWAFAQLGNDARMLKPDDVLPAEDCVVYLSTDGLAAHRGEWENTAAYDALVDSRLAESIESYIRSILAAKKIEDAEVDQLVTDLGRHFREYGGTLAVYATAENVGDQTLPDVVLAFANGRLLLGQLTKAYELLQSRGLLPPEATASEVNGRFVLGSGMSSINVWEEDDIFYVTGPADMADRVDARLANVELPVGQSTYGKSAGSFARGYIDVAAGLQSLSNRVGPKPDTGISVLELLDVAGLSGLEAITSSSRFNGRAVDTTTAVLIDQENLGLFDATHLEPLTLTDLPPLPERVAAFSFTRFDLLDFFDGLLVNLTLASEMAGDGPEIDPAFAAFENEMGFPVRDLFAGFGDVIGAYDQTDAGVLAPPIVLAASVRDREVLTRVFNAIADKIVAEANEEVTISKANEDGYDRITVSTGTPVSVSFGLSDDWAVAAMTPSYLSDFFKRLDRTQPSWKPSEEVLARRPELAESFRGVSYVDTAASWKQAMSLLPMGFGFASNALGGIPQPRLPRTRSITKPMFPNVSVTVDTATGVETRSSSSTFTLGNTFSAGGVTNVGVIAVGTALLLPAVQQAREAARRSNSKNNLKQLALAIHNYHETHGQLPTGTIVESADDVEARLSWLVDVTPFLEMARVYNEVDKSAAWDTNENLNVLSNANGEYFTNPSMPARKHESGLPMADYAGCTGLGDDSATLGARDPKAGMFGYDRRTRFADVRDGLANTMMVGEVRAGDGPWAAGGSSTLRGFTKTPHIKGPDGFDGGQIGGSQFVMGDGRVVFLSESTDESVTSALMTINGGELVEDF